MPTVKRLGRPPKQLQPSIPSALAQTKQALDTLVDGAPELLESLQEQRERLLAAVREIDGQIDTVTAIIKCLNDKRET